MKYLKLYEQLFNYNIDVFNLEEFNTFLDNNFSRYNYDEDLSKKIKYFSYDDLSTIYSDDEFNDSKRYIVAYNKDDILGISMFAKYYGNYSISYLSTNKEYLHKGISEKILEKIFEYYSKNYDETLYFSGYSVEGWKYLRNNILKYSKKYGVKIYEKPIEYGDDKELIKKSEEEIKKLYK